MIWNWLIGQLRRVPNPTPLLQSVFTYLLALGFVALAVVILFAVIFPWLDTLLAPHPYL